MTARSSRRELICEAALDLAAEGGNHALTHQGIDTRLGLPRGSTSYYYRTRRALVSAAVEHLTSRSRDRFAASAPTAPPTSAEDAAEFIAAQLEALVTDRRRDVLARYALMADAAGDDALRHGVASCLFSVPAATALMRELGAADAEESARSLISLLEGLVFDMTFGSRTDADEPPGRRAASVRRAITLWILALVDS